MGQSQTSGVARWLGRCLALVSVWALSWAPVAAFASETKATIVPDYMVVRAQSAPIVDGVLDDPAWEGLTLERLEWEVDAATTWTQTLEFDGAFRAVWRDGVLYVALRLDDDDVVALPYSPEESDRLQIFVEDRASNQARVYTVPVLEGNSREDPYVPFAAWSGDGSVCELSLDTEAMYTDRPEMRVNLVYVDADSDEMPRRIGWVPQGPGAIEPQWGTLRFEIDLTSDAKLVTSWGKMKTLY